MVINVWAVSDNGTILHYSSPADYNIAPERLVESLSKELVETVNSGACVDNYLQDQLLVFMAMASSPSAMKIHKLTLHSEAVINLINQSELARVEVDGSIIRVYPNN